jgi:hypothetical protein
VEFEWDKTKEVENVQKHGISFLEAVESFSDPHGFQLEETRHPQIEAKFYCVGKARSGKILTTRFTRRGGLIRIFGTACWRKFGRYYHERTKTE